MRTIEKMANIYRKIYYLKAVVFRANEQGIKTKTSVVKALSRIIQKMGNILEIKSTPDFIINDVKDEVDNLFTAFCKKNGELKKSAFNTKGDLRKISLSALDLFPPINIYAQDDPEFAKLFCRILEYNYVVNGTAKKMQSEQHDFYKIMFNEIYELPPLTVEDWKVFDIKYTEPTEIEILALMLKHAVAREDYSKASEIRDKIITLN